MLSSLWQCDTAEEHFVNIGLDGNGEKQSHNSQRIHFELAWSCPGQGVPSRPSKPLRLSVDSLAEIRGLTSDTSPLFDLQQVLGNALEESLRSTSSQAPSSSIARPKSDERIVGDVALPDLHTIPNLCHHLENRPPGPVHYLGVFQKSRTFKHFVCTPFDQSHDVSTTKSLKDALIAAKESSEGYPTSRENESSKDSSASSTSIPLHAMAQARMAKPRHCLLWHSGFRPRSTADAISQISSADPAKHHRPTSRDQHNRQRMFERDTSALLRTKSDALQSWSHAHRAGLRFPIAGPQRTGR